VTWRVFFVRDNGLGIDPRFHDKSLACLINRSQASTGIGLALVKRIIEVHGGRIWVESEGLGHGATFCFTLPAPV
jgi:signal transduction histidine kinase